MASLPVSTFGISGISAIRTEITGIFGDSFEHVLNPFPSDTSNNDDSNPAPVFVDAEQSSYEETLGVVSNTDDSNMLCLTFRSWILGLLFTAVYAVVNKYFAFRTNNYSPSSTFIILLAFPVGRFLAWILPTRTWLTGSRFAFSLNPGPFTIKEHTIIYNMSFVVVSSADSIKACNLFVQMQSYPTDDMPPMPGYFTGLIFVLATQLLGYSLAGVLRRLIVWPSEMVWRFNFPYMVILRTMNEPESPMSVRWLGLTRRRFFAIVFVSAFIYQWLPGVIFPMLMFFPWWCLIRPSSTLLSQLTAPDGLAMGTIALDWLQLYDAYNFLLILPWWAYANMIFGLVLVGWVLVPILYYSNVANWARLPIVGEEKYSVIGNSDQTQLTVTAALVTYIFLGALSALFLHTLLFSGRDLYRYARTSIHHRQNDVHCTLIGKYKEAPGWIYALMFAITFITLCLICHFAHLMPWYYMFVVVGIGTVYTVSMGVLKAQAAVYITTDFFFYVIGAVILKNRPMAIATFYVLIWSLQNQTLALLQNYKLAHYMKVSPRSMFIVQLVSTILSSTLAYAITRHLLSSVPGFCTTNKDWQCNSVTNDFISYARTDYDTQFGLKSVYPWLLWVMVAIAVLPLFVWFARLLYPRTKWLRHVHIPVMFLNLYQLQTPQFGYLLLPTWLLIGTICHKIAPRWWFDRYAFLFSMAMQMGARVSNFFAFFILTYNNVTFPSWWGTQKTICQLANANGTSA